MAKLYFKYGAMGSSKTAQALITKFNYEERNMGVWLIKPRVDSRDGVNVVRSRAGLEGIADVINDEDSIIEKLESVLKERRIDVIVADECQFFSEEHINMLREIVDKKQIPVLCFGLRTDFLTHLFSGSRRLMEIADCIEEIKTMCHCGRKATVNARVDENGHTIVHGDQILLGGNDRYIAMCHKCWKESVLE